MTSDLRCVYIFRGLPGSGKSYQASLLAVEAQKKGQSVRYCSEEFYFIGPDGKFRFEQFQVDAARLSCLSSFNQALADGVQLVLVDNISATQSSYNHFVQLAASHLYEVKVVELPCPDVMNLQRFFARSRKTTPSEGYSYDYIVSLWSLWEPHSDQLPPLVHTFHDSSMTFDNEYLFSTRSSLSSRKLFFIPAQSFSHQSCNISPQRSLPQHPHYPKKEELLQQLYQLKQQELVLQQKLKQQKLCDQLSCRSRRFSSRRDGATTVILAPYNPQVNHAIISKANSSSLSSFAFPLLKEH